MPVVLICIVFSAIVSSIPSVFMQQVISVIDSNYKTGDWEGVSGKIIRLVTILAVFYIFFTAVLNLIPDQKYEKYVRFFMGLLLIFMMSTPIFSILGKGSELTESFLNNFSEENREKELREFQNIQKVYLEKGYELELEQKIRETLEKRGIEVYKVKVNIEGEETQANLVLKTEISQEERKELKDALVEEWGLKENRICIQIVRNESGKMGNPVAHRSTSGSSGDACIQ